MRRPGCCHVSLAFVLKFLNFLQAFIGVSILVYSAWMLNQWKHHTPIIPPPSSPSPETAQVSGGITPLDFAVHLVSGFEQGMEFELNALKLPAPWFIYSFMGLGVLICCITFIGCIAAEAINGCCLCFYTILVMLLTLLEAALVAFIAIDRHWEKDLPFDPTGELDSLRSFIEDNIDICRWVGLAVIVIQALSLLLSMILRGMVSTRRPDYDIEDDYDARSRTREPLLNQHSIQGDARGTHSDIWSSRIRDKYGLNSGDKYTSVNQNPSVSTKSKQ